MVAVKAYVWDPDKPTRREGVRILYGRTFIFLPWDIVTTVSDRLIDQLEIHENEQRQ